MLSHFEELMDQFNQLHASVQITAKLKQGIVFLATPPQTSMRETPNSSMMDKTHKDRVQLYENSIVMWTQQIKSELQRNPEDALVQDHHPQPLQELTFWQERYHKLTSISTQLNSDTHKKLQKELDRAKSACTPSFSKLNRDVDMKKDEAEANHKLLEFLRPDFQKMQKDDLDFAKLSSHFVPVMHKILLIWQHSNHYHSPARLVVLFRMICNTVIAQATRFVSGPQIFSYIQNEEASFAVEKLEQTKHVCRLFRDTFRNKKAESDELAKDKDCLRHSQGGWLLQTSNIFCRLDKFQERCEDILDFTRTVITFNKLEKIDIGGTKGKAATSWVVQIFKEFQACVEKFQQVNYDIMDVDESQFDEDYNAFKTQIKELDRRLAAVFEKGFESNNTIHGRIKLFQSFEVFAERNLICGHLALKFKELLAMYKQDLAIVHDIFTSAKSQEEPPGFQGMPPVSGAIYWVRCLNQRIKDPKEVLARLNKIVSSGDDTNYQVVETQHNNLLKLLEKFEQDTFNEWSLTCAAVAQKRQQKLLRRDPKTCLMRVNFDAHVSAMLKEVHYLKLIYEDSMIPSEALEVYSQMVEFRGWINQLNDIVTKYNSVLTELLPVEEPLLCDRTTKMDESLRQGITDLKWQSPPDSINEFLVSAAASVREVFDVVNVMKGNLRDISALLAKWCSTPLLERSSKPQKVEEFDKIHKSTLQGKFMSIQDDAQSIHDKLKDSLAALKVPKTSSQWRDYVDFVNNIVIEGFVSAVATSLQCFLEYLDPLMISKNESLPLFDVTLVLDKNSITFDPPFSTDPYSENASSELTLRGILDSFLKDFFAMATIANRVDTSVGDYLNEMKEHFQMQCLLALVSELIDNTELKCTEYTEMFYENSFLFMEDINESFSEFMKENSKDLVTNFELVDNCSFTEIMKLVGIDIDLSIPPFELFDEKIVRFRQLAQEISNLPNPVDIHWLRVDAAPVKNALVALCNKWEKRYSDVLVNFTQDLVRSVDDFLCRVDQGLNNRNFDECPEDEISKLLYARMEDIRDVRLSATALQQLWAPLKKSLALLKKHDVSVSEDIPGLVDVSPMRAQTVHTLSLKAQEEILGLKSNEEDQIKQKISQFQQTVSDFRIEFQSKCPFRPVAADEETGKTGPQIAFGIIDQYYAKLKAINAKSEELNNLERLFTLPVSKQRALNDSKQDLVLLKRVWDVAQFVEGIFEAWDAMLWDKIETGDLLEQVKQLQNLVKKLPKECKNWEVTRNLEARIKNMNTVLPLIDQLHSPSMQDRHWNMLKIAVKVNFDKGADFCFKDLLDLQLHKFADDVSEIVDQSAKEEKIGKKLKIIEEFWVKCTVSFDMSREDCPLWKDLAEINERLESDSMEMASMASQGRFIEFCQAQVDKWVGILRTIDSVLGIWQKVQADWCRLEPIFMLSDDIRSQLPDDSKRFEQVDNDWKSTMADASLSTSIVDICCAEGREEALVTISKSIETCEKALKDYLEQKKKAFPRFYFVSNQALLDILSNGNKPKEVARKIGDCFDGVGQLDFTADDGTSCGGIVAKDGEKVKFFDECALGNGVAVETYLANLENHIRLTLRQYLELARDSADNWESDKPRELWLHDYCAQLALVVTQIVWTEETQHCFDEMEGGSETAMKDYAKVCSERILKLVEQVRGPLNGEQRAKIITIITIDVHARDVIDNFVAQKIIESSAFQWQSQLRFYWQMEPKGEGGKSNLVSLTPDDQKTCVIKICDWVTIYLYEYIGNCGRLVITPLTDRCYITLTQALNLTLGGAPAGPAGTGKTETTKDLSRALGLPIVVFNCSDQMSYLTTANIFMGLASTGAWGCFDEFNRISIEVLSVVSSQVKSVLDAIRANQKNFLFMDEDIKLISTTGSFITMNPGYAGRTELPENLKALFRSCAMVVPDLTFICENMLLSEGFEQARLLANKFVTLYGLSKDLLSKQMHYDWGLRAVKSLLRQAGGLKRAEPDVNEEIILMRALRDFNTPKIVTEDLAIFLRLIEDLFTGIVAESKTDPQFQQLCEKAGQERNLQTDGSCGFTGKVVSLNDILGVRHCCFIIGPSGSGKTETWKTLLQAYKNDGQKADFETVNPKAVTADELYGVFKNGDFKNGCIGCIMGNMSKNEGGYTEEHKHKWIILDGDIDATWIESMNTVMDDNKVLTLVSNDRIPFTPTMRMILEIQDMKHASPATVSRGGVLYINETDIGWKPYVESWRDSIPDNVANSTFYVLFQQYFENNIEYIRSNNEFSCKILDMAFVQSICCFIDGLMNGASKETAEAIKNASVDDQKLIYEAYFAYAMMWTIGGAVADSRDVNYSKQFSTWIKSVCKAKLPDKHPDGADASCFEFRYDAVSREWVSWQNDVKAYSNLGTQMFQNIVVSNSDIEARKAIIKLHMQQNKPVIFVGVAGTAKTTIVRDYISELDDTFTSARVNMNYYTSSYQLQSIMETNVEKRTGRTFGPPGNKKCLFFLDDLNMPFVDTYETQSAIMLLTQLLSYESCFNREDMSERKEIKDLRYVACMNPKAGSFHVNGRLQRRFTVLSTYTPTADKAAIAGIFGPILQSHLQSFDPPVQALAEPIVEATFDVLKRVLSTPTFLPSAVKFHYQFNLKDASNLFQGLINTDPSLFRTQSGVQKYLRLWGHDMQRIFMDRLLDPAHEKELFEVIKGSAKKCFGNAYTEDCLAFSSEAPYCVFTSFMSAILTGGDKKYMEHEMATIRKEVVNRLVEYNESNAAMNLVLFGMAICHVCRICRIIDLPCGHALLVGVGGSGKQSLARLAAFINEMAVESIVVSQSFGQADFLAKLQEIYRKSVCSPGIPQIFLITDVQIRMEKFLVPLNDLLSMGVVADLFAKEEYEEIFGKIRNQAKGAGFSDDPESLFSYATEKFRKNLSVVFGHSPVGDELRIRARRFPALVSCMNIDWFHAWSLEALNSVATRQLADVNFPNTDLLEPIAASLANAHLSIDEANLDFLKLEKRFNYTTPKSFLELISFYKSNLGEKRSDVSNTIEKLDKGLGIMQQVEATVQVLNEELVTVIADVEQKVAATEVLIQEVTVAKGEAQVEQEAAAIEQAKTEEVAAVAAAAQEEADGELAEALPAMEAAKEAVNCLTKPWIQELKGLGSPPPECAEVTAAVAFLLHNEKKKIDWKASQKMMNNPGQFLDEILAFDANNIPEETLAKVEPFIALPFFNFDVMKGKSKAAAYLCSWVVNIYTYNCIYKKVKPLMEKVEEATAEKAAAEAALVIVLAKVAEVEAMVAALEEKQNAAEASMNEAKDTQARLLAKQDLAGRLINGLAGEKKRWAETVKTLGEKSMQLFGDCLIASAFVGYISPFSATFRKKLWNDTWITDVKERKIPCTPELKPLDVLADEATIAVWMNEGLPADAISIENAAVLTNCKRWPLMIDPQLQGVKWIKQRLGEDLCTIQLTQKKWLNKVTESVTMGKPLLIEAVGQEIDAVLDPLLSRSIITKNASAFVKLGDDEIDYDKRFSLVLQTKLANPHYRPEIAAQCTLINFLVTPMGLEDQILAMVCNIERADLEADKQKLVREQNDFKVTLAKLEDQLLQMLSEADPATILDNVQLIEGLEECKRTSEEISLAVKVSKETEVKINEAREIYRPSAAEGSMLFFLITKLCEIEHMYQFSLDSFVTFLKQAIDKAEADEKVEKRVVNLKTCIRMTIFRWVNRGLFERHKLIFCSMLAFQLLRDGALGETFDAPLFDFLLRGPRKEADEPNPLKEWLPDNAWFSVLKLCELEGFEAFAQNMEKDAPTRFRDWFSEAEPENCKLPLDWKKLDNEPVKKLAVIRALRPDRMTTALAHWIRASLPNGTAFMDCDASSSFYEILSTSFEQSSNVTPMFFILSPGADPVKQVEKLGLQLINLQTNVNYHNVAMGQGQDVVAMAKLDLGHKEGHWVMLQNVHLMPSWCKDLEKKLDVYAIEGSHPNFRLFLSADPAKGVPIGILDRSIKLTNEPPQGLLANLRRAFAEFDKNTFEELESKEKNIIFGLCHFHSIMLERKKFGPLGFNMMYPFSTGDLKDSASVLHNYLENATGGGKIPWDDLRYIFGEIMYGGHIVDDEDRRLCKTYLEFYMHDDLVDAETQLVPYGSEGSPSFMSPTASGYDFILAHINSMPSPEKPQYFGLHPNAEINFRTFYNTINVLNFCCWFSF